MSQARFYNEARFKGSLSLLFSPSLRAYSCPASQHAAAPCQTHLSACPGGSRHATTHQKTLKFF